MDSKNKSRKNIRKTVLEDNLFGSDENFAFIAGYTSGGVPYGVTWEEMAEIGQREKEVFGEEHCYQKNDDVDLPFD